MQGSQNWKSTILVTSWHSKSEVTGSSASLARRRAIQSMGSLENVGGKERGEEKMEENLPWPAEAIS
ncbi:hypothetical protein RRG08_059291 [Elysia crispata]|uniref:Uncharacterized protein n=1 Tax=Elysia crispata TaxID=231223 RepID=A0AAE0ZBX5_9GAST|nr:hypothetical protein RRG08_059291 [Elysia crispata]